MLVVRPMSLGQIRRQIWYVYRSARAPKIAPSTPPTLPGTFWFPKALDVATADVAADADDAAEEVTPAEATLLPELTALASALVVPPEVEEILAVPVAEDVELAQDAAVGCTKNC